MKSFWGAFVFRNRFLCGFMFVYRMAGNFGGKIFWRIAENMSFGGINFGG